MGDRQQFEVAMQPLFQVGDKVRHLFGIPSWDPPLAAGFQGVVLGPYGSTTCRVEIAFGERRAPCHIDEVCKEVDYPRLMGAMQPFKTGDMVCHLLGMPSWDPPLAAGIEGVVIGPQDSTAFPVLCDFGGRRVPCTIDAICKRVDYQPLVEAMQGFAKGDKVCNLRYMPSWDPPLRVGIEGVVIGPYNNITFPVLIDFGGRQAPCRTDAICKAAEIRRLVEAMQSFRPGDKVRHLRGMPTWDPPLEAGVEGVVAGPYNSTKYPVLCDFDGRQAPCRIDAICQAADYQRLISAMQPFRPGDKVCHLLGMPSWSPPLEAGVQGVVIGPYNSTTSPVLIDFGERRAPCSIESMCLDIDYQRLLAAMHPFAIGDEVCHLRGKPSWDPPLEAGARGVVVGPYNSTTSPILIDFGGRRTPCGIDDGTLCIAAAYPLLMAAMQPFKTGDKVCHLTGISTWDPPLEKGVEGVVIGPYNSETFPVFINFGGRRTRCSIDAICKASAYQSIASSMQPRSGHLFIHSAENRSFIRSQSGPLSEAALELMNSPKRCTKIRLRAEGSVGIEKRPRSASQLWETDLDNGPIPFNSQIQLPKQGSNLGGGNRLDKGTSYGKKDFKARWYNTKFEGSPIARQSKGVAEHARAFKELGHIIEDLSRGARLDSMSEASLAGEVAVQAELRRMRRVEQESRDPHRKIEEKLKNKRNSESFKSRPKGGIPMQPVGFGGEHVMVDAGVVRNEIQERLNRKIYLVSAANATLRTSSSMPALCKVK